MRTTGIALLALSAMVEAATAGPAVIIYRPVPSATVIAPLTSPAAASNQALLGQINASLVQRRTVHDILAASVRPVPAPVALRSR